jgi:membrane protein YqaA with SNARE-associated domain
VKLGPIALLHKFSVMLFAVMKPLGVWGVGGLALIDSALIPIPVSMDGIVVGYVATNPHRFLIYCLIAAAASAIGSLVPFFIGRINRERYERMRDRFENQEFLAMMIPAMCPPPFPLKVFEFAAGVFEMKPVAFVLAIFCGKMVQFVIASVLYIFFGPALFHSGRRFFHEHIALAIGLIGAALLLIAFYMVRKVFDRRRGVRLPVEEEA